MKVSLPTDHNYTPEVFKRRMTRATPVIEIPTQTRWIDNGWNVLLVCFVGLFLSVAWVMA